MTESSEIPNGAGDRPPDGPATRGIRSRPAALVGAGILLSRIIGLVRERVFGFYFGVTSEADAFRAAFRIPNLLQNLFGEGVLSASFIPVYASLVADEEREDASRVAGAVFAILALVVSLLVAVGVVAAPFLVDLIAAGFPADKRDLTVTLVRVLFPGAGLLVLSAWCLGILNSHKKFFLSYAAPVLWNVAMIATLLWFGGRGNLQELAVWLAWGSVVGSALQMLVQLPLVLKLIGRLRLGIESRSSHVREIVRNFGPVFVGRGVVQISAYVDAWIASFLINGSVAALTYAQNLVLLPVSLFGMSVSAAKLPEMSSLRGSEPSVATALRQQLDEGLRTHRVLDRSLGSGIRRDWRRGGGRDLSERQVRSNGRRLGLGHSRRSSGRTAREYARPPLLVVALRAPRHEDTVSVRAVRVTLTISLGYLFALQLGPRLGLAPQWGAAGIALASSLAGWVEFALLRRAVNRRVGATGIGRSRLLTLWSSALARGGRRVGSPFVRADRTGRC